MVSVGTSWHAFPFACGAGPDHNLIVWTFRNALFSPGVAQGACRSSACAQIAAQANPNQHRYFIPLVIRISEGIISSWTRFALSTSSQGKPAKISSYIPYSPDSEPA
jgi:hypothetical protein